MRWLTWRAKERGDRVSQAELDVYRTEQHRILPEIIGYLSTVAALNIEVYYQLVPHTDKVFKLDTQIAKIGLWLAKDRDKAIVELVAKFEEASKMETDLPQIVGDIVSKSFQAPVPVAPRTRV